MLLLLSQPWGVSRCAPGNIACTGIWKVPALRGIKVCTGEHCVHWMINRAPTLPPPPPQGSQPFPPGSPPYQLWNSISISILKPIMKLNLNLNFEFELETKFKFTPRVPNPPSRVPTLPFPPGSPPYQLWNSTQYANSKPISILPTRVPTLPNLNFKLKNKLKTPIQISNWTQNSHSRASTKLWKQTWLILDLNLLMRSLRTGYEVFKL